MIDTNPKYEFCDLNIVPCVTTGIESRSECSPYIDNDKKLLPLFAAPMSSVVDDTNYQLFIEQGITPVIHRNVDFTKRYNLTKQGIWCAWSIDEFEQIFCYKSSELQIYDEIANFSESSDTQKTIYALLDTANGHMQKGLTLIHRAKEVADEHHADLKVMYGNIANPEAYIEYAKAGVDYCRIGIGGGEMCLTTPNTGIHYPYASLVSEIREIRDNHKVENFLSDFGEEASDISRQINQNIKETVFDKYFTYPKIVADGSIKNYDNAYVALACGADYVMIGTLFTSCIESAGELVSTNIGLHNRHCIYVGRVAALGRTNSGSFMTGMKHHFRIGSDARKDWRENILPANGCLSDCYVDNCNTLDINKGLYLDKEQMEIEEVKRFLIKHIPLGKKSYGMSSREAQVEHLKMQGKEVTRASLKTSEGKSKIVPVKYTIAQWTDNFKNLLKSTMSYTDCRSLKEFCSGDVRLCVKSHGVWEAINK